MTLESGDLFMFVLCIVRDRSKVKNDMQSSIASAAFCAGFGGQNPETSRAIKAPYIQPQRVNKNFQTQQAFIFVFLCGAKDPKTSHGELGKEALQPNV